MAVAIPKGTELIMKVTNRKMEKFPVSQANINVEIFTFHIESHEPSSLGK